MKTTNVSATTANTERDELVAEGLVTIEEGAAFLAMARTKVYDLMKTGSLPYVKFGKSRRLPMRGLRQYASQHLVLPAEEHPNAV